MVAKKLRSISEVIDEAGPPWNRTKLSRSAA